MSAKHVPPPDFDPSSYKTPVKQAPVAGSSTYATPSTLASTAMGSAISFASMSTGSSEPPAFASKPSPMETSVFNASGTAGLSATTPSFKANNTPVVAAASTAAAAASTAAVSHPTPTPLSKAAFAELVESSDDESEEEPLKEGEVPKLEVLDLLNYEQVSSYIKNTYELDGEPVPTVLAECWDLLFSETQPWMLKAFLMRYKPKSAVPTQKKAVVTKLKKQLVKLSKKRDHDTAMKPANPPAISNVSNSTSTAVENASKKAAYGPPIPSVIAGSKM